MRIFIIFTILATTLPISQPSLTKLASLFKDKGIDIKSLHQLVNLRRRTANATIDPSLQKKLFSGQKQNVIITFTQGMQPVINKMNNLTFSSRSEKRFALTGAQKAFASLTQAHLQAFLKNAGFLFKTFWINNLMSINDADSNLVQKIAGVPGVKRIGEEPQYRIEPPIVSNGSQTRANTAFAWGIEKIRANQAWEICNGQGIVVANIDTGVRYTHEALTGRWRSSYGWYDPYDGTLTPNDQSGHGTHTMGTLAGANGIGVAPGATWIACKGCSPSLCNYTCLIECGQWIQCPFKSDQTTDCTMAPHVVSNSWGGGQGDMGYDSIIQSWTAAGIISVFSIGNTGQNGCRSAISPADNGQVFGVASTDQNEKISYYSSSGPSVNGNLKPDIAAPGSQIRSCWNTSDTAYNTISGTSMACPHVSGVIALMFQKNSTLTYDEAYKAITGTAVTSTMDTSTAPNCGITPNQFPNYSFGYGRVDAVNCLNAI